MPSSNNNFQNSFQKRSGPACRSAASETKTNVTCKTNADWSVQQQPKSTWGQRLPQAGDVKRDKANPLKCFDRAEDPAPLEGASSLEYEGRRAAGRRCTWLVNILGLLGPCLVTGRNSARAEAPWGDSEPLHHQMIPPVSWREGLNMLNKQPWTNRAPCSWGSKQ